MASAFSKNISCANLISASTRVFQQNLTGAVIRLSNLNDGTLPAADIGAKADLPPKMASASSKKISNANLFNASARVFQQN